MLSGAPTLNLTLLNLKTAPLLTVSELSAIFLFVLFFFFVTAAVEVQTAEHRDRAAFA